MNLELGSHRQNFGEKEDNQKNNPINTQKSIIGES